MFEANDDNFAELHPSTRDFSEDGCGPCKPHEASTNHMPMLNLRKLLGMI
jgi:hypothetical protein